MAGLSNDDILLGTGTCLGAKPDASSVKQVGRTCSFAARARFCALDRASDRKRAFLDGVGLGYFDTDLHVLRNRTGILSRKPWRGSILS